MAQSTEEQELEALREQAVYFSQALEEINQRIDELSEEGEA
jgi:prefoldin subunit 5